MKWAVFIVTMAPLVFLLWRTYPRTPTHTQVMQQPMPAAWMAVLTEYAKDLGVDSLNAHAIAVRVFDLYCYEPVSDNTARRMVADLKRAVGHHNEVNTP